MRSRLSLVCSVLVAGIILTLAVPLRAADSIPVYKGIACNIDGSYLCGGACPPDRCYCCEKPVRICN